MRNKGRFTAAEELITLGCGELINITDKNARHKNVNFPGHEHPWLTISRTYIKLFNTYFLNINYE